MRYQKIESKIWNDEKFINLTSMQQRLFFYILTCPHGNLIGMFVLKKGYICEDLKCLPKDLEKDLESLSQSELIYFDKSCQVILIKNFLKHNPITNPNQRKAAIKIIEDLPKTPLLQKFLVLNKDLCEVLPEVLLKPETETETEEETETETEEELSCASGDTDTVKKNGFDVFWDAYPRKVAKPSARKAWKSAIKSKDFPGIEKILSAINQQKTWQQWATNNGKFIPHPATWINREGWCDKPPEVGDMTERTYSNMKTAWRFANGD